MTVSFHNRIISATKIVNVTPLARAILTIFFSIFKCLSAELRRIFFSVFSQKSKSRINWPLTSSNVGSSLSQQVVINSFSRLINEKDSKKSDFFQSHKVLLLVHLQTAPECRILP